MLCSFPGPSPAYYAATLGSAETAGWVWREIAQACGLQPKTQVHAVGDGAPWILEKFKDNFGWQGSYLLDFYHVSQYLAAAVPPNKNIARRKEWLRRQQGRLLNNRPEKVLKTLAGRLEPEESTEAPVRAAYDYITNRVDHLDYLSARKNQLPIGSGEVESGHGHVIQDRLSSPVAGGRKPMPQPFSICASHGLTIYGNPIGQIDKMVDAACKI